MQRWGFDKTTNKIYALDQTTRTLLEINPLTVEASPIGNFTYGASNGLSAHPITGELFASVGVDPGYLAKIDKETGSAELIGTFDEANSVHMRALSFHPISGILYGNGGGTGVFADGRLATIDIESGHATPIGEPSGQVTALSFAEIKDVKLTIDAILSFFDQSVTDGSLTGYGNGNSANGRLNALRNMLEAVSDLIEIDDIEGACRQLRTASRKCDSALPPPDFVAGSAVSKLNDMILELMTELGCE